MTNLIELAKKQNGTITIEQLETALKELEEIIKKEKPLDYDYIKSEYRPIEYYDGKLDLLKCILTANEVK